MDYQANRVKQIKASPAMAVSIKARERRAAGHHVIDLSLGEPDFDTPENICRAAERAMKNGQTHYTPADGTTELKDAIREKFRRENGLAVERNEVSAANGAKQALLNALFATLEPGDEVLVPAPYWVSYTDMVLLLGGSPKVLPCRGYTGFKLTPEQLEETITARTRWLILNSPSNPSGVTYSKAELQAIGEVITRHPRLLVVADEIYEHICYDPTGFCSFAVACPSLKDRTVIINGVSKTYAMTGWRIGYAAGPAGLIGAMGKIQSQTTTNPSSISQAAAIEALTGPQDFVAKAVTEYRARRNLLMDGLSRIDGLKCAVPDGAFYAYPDASAFMGSRTPSGMTIEDDSALVTYLLENANVAAVQGAAFGLEPFFRLSYALNRDDLEIALDRMGQSLGELTPSVTKRPAQ